jgi:hypothetical protein
MLLIDNLRRREVMMPDAFRSTADSAVAPWVSEGVITSG